MIVIINSSVGESCFTEKTYLTGNNASFKLITRFTTEKPSFSQKLQFSLENLARFSPYTLFHSVETGCMVVKQNLPPYIMLHHCKIGLSHY